MKDMARRYAALGYAAIVPALYSRDGFLTVVEHSDMDRARDALNARPNAQTVGDLQGGLEFLRGSPHVNDRIGVVGFCSGGRLALVFASSGVGAGRPMSASASTPTACSSLPKSTPRRRASWPQSRLPHAGTVRRRRHQPLARRCGPPARGTGAVRQDLRVCQLPPRWPRLHVRHPRELPS